MKVDDSEEEQLSDIPSGWEYAIKSISGKDFPDFVTLDKATWKLKFEPDDQKYDLKRFYFNLVLQKVGNSSLKKEKEIEVFIGDPVVLQQKEQKLTDFENELKAEHYMGDYGAVDYKLPVISGPGSTQWEYAVTAVQGKTYPAFMTLNKATWTLEFRPDKDEYSGVTFYWLLTMKEVGSDLFERGIEMQITVLPPTELEYKVEITDGATGSGKITFSLPIHMAWLKDNFENFFSAFLVDKATGDVKNTELK